MQNNTVYICAVPREEWDVAEEDERDWPSEDLLYFTFFSACNFSFFFIILKKYKYNAPSSERWKESQFFRSLSSCWAKERKEEKHCGNLN